MPLLLIPIVGAITGGAGYAWGSWSSGGWVKWLMVFAVMVLIFFGLKKAGVIK